MRVHIIGEWSEEKESQDQRKWLSHDQPVDCRYLVQLILGTVCGMTKKDQVCVDLSSSWYASCSLTSVLVSCCVLSQPQNSMMVSAYPLSPSTSFLHLVCLGRQQSTNQLKQYTKSPGSSSLLFKSSSISSKYRSSIPMVSLFPPSSKPWLYRSTIPRKRCLLSPLSSASPPFIISVCYFIKYVIYFLLLRTQVLQFWSDFLVVRRRSCLFLTCRYSAENVRYFLPHSHEQIYQAQDSLRDREDEGTIGLLLTFYDIG